VAQLFTYLLTQRCTACHAHNSLFTFASWLGKTSIFYALIAPKPYAPHQNSPTKGTCLGCRLLPYMIRIARHSAVWAVRLCQTPLESTHFSCFGTCKTRAQKSEIFQRFTHAHTDSRLYFKNAHNRSRMCGRKSALYWWQKKTLWHPRMELLWRFLLLFGRLHTFTPHVYSMFHPNLFRFGQT